ncbi:MAG: hypothetical protein NVS4B3_03540 [Gemmatimonadaceae bacterium]
MGQHNMEAIVQRLYSVPLMCEAKTTNELLLVFVVPNGAAITLGDRLDFDAIRLDSVLPVRNVTRKASFSILLQKINVHDLRLPSGHGGSRTPSDARIAGA